MACLSCHRIYCSGNIHNILYKKQTQDIKQRRCKKKQRSKSRDFLLLGNLDSFLCQIAKITILAEFWVQQTQRHKKLRFCRIENVENILNLCRFFYCRLFQVEFMKIKTTANHRNF